MTKHRIVYESEDDDTEDRAKKYRAAPDDATADAAAPAGARHSERAGRSSGGRLAQMKQFEQMQMERSKRLSKIDIATQREDINPMAPSSQGVDGSSRKGQVPSSEKVASQTMEPPVSSSPQPEFLLAGPNQQFGFRIPDSVSQTERNTRAPARTRFSGSQPSYQGSLPPSSRTASLFSDVGGNSTAPTSRAPSICSSSADRNLVRQDIPVTQHPSASSQVDARLQRSSRFEDFPPDVPSRPPTNIQRTASFYSQPLCVNGSSHSLFATPDHDDEAGLQIDEASPSEDDRIVEANLRWGEYSRGSPPPIPDDEHMPRRSPLPDPFQRESLSDDDNEPNDVTARYQQSQRSVRLPNDHALSQARSRDDTTRIDRQCSGAPDGNDGTNVNGAIPHANRPSLRAQAPENVVNVHCRRNRAPRLPSNSQLLAARQRQQALTATSTDEVPGNNDGQDRPSVDCQSGPVTERSEPWQLQFYDPQTRDVIERAKQFSHCDAASINPFPARATFNAKAVEYIDEAIVECRSHSLPVSDGWWPQRESSITRLLWEDLGNWQSYLRKKARTFVTQRYTWDPENRRDCNIQIAKDLLGSGGLFLKDGVDEEGHANNLAHPALSGLIIDFFYTGATSVGKLFPEVFATEVPRVTVAIAATALKVVLDEVAAGKAEVNFRVPTYAPVYTEILGLMNKCDTSVIHRAKTTSGKPQFF